MRRAGVILFAVIVLAVLSGIGYGLVRLAWALATGLSGIAPETSAVIVAASTTTILAIVILVGSRRATSIRSIAASETARRGELYGGRFARGIEDRVRTTRESEHECRERFCELVEEMAGDLITWGSPEVVRALDRLRIAGPSSDEWPLVFDDLVRAVRRDLGTSNRGLDRGELVAVLLPVPSSSHDEPRMGSRP